MNVINVYLAHLDAARLAVREVLLGLYGPGLNWQPQPTTPSLFALAHSVLMVEQREIAVALGGREAVALALDNDDPSDLLFYLDDAASTTTAVLAALDEHNLEVQERLLTTLEGYHEHLGRMRLTRQLWEAM